MLGFSAGSAATRVSANRREHNERNETRTMYLMEVDNVKPFIRVGGIGLAIGSLRFGVAFDVGTNGRK